MSHNNRKANRFKVRRRIRKKISGTADRPRLAVHFSNMNVYAQLIDDDKGVTLASASTLDKDVGKTVPTSIRRPRLGKWWQKEPKKPRSRRWCLTGGDISITGK